MGCIKTVAAGLSVALAVLVTGVIRPAAGASTQPDRPYRLLYRSVAGSEPLQSVFVIVSPDGYPSVTTFAKLEWMIEHAVIGPATLRWEPSDMRSGTPEPLDSPEAVKSLAS